MSYWLSKKRVVFVCVCVCVCVRVEKFVLPLFNYILEV